MIIRTLLAFLVLLPLFFGGLMPPRSCVAAELSLAQQEELLDKAQAALLWFRTLGNESDQNRMPRETYHEQITAIELIQVASLLHSYQDAEQSDLAERLLLMLPFYRLTPEESFEINDIIGEIAIFELGDIATAELTRIPAEANNFRTRELNNAERVILHQEPETALDVMRAVDLLSVVGRPVLVRHYLRRLLAGTPVLTPEESAKIVETLGTQKLLTLAIHPEFVPLSKEAVAKIIDSAKEHWQDEDRIAEALSETNWFTERDGSREPATVSPDALPALRVLWKGEPLSVYQVFEKLATIEDEQEADQLVAVLLSTRTDMKEALAAALQSANPKLRYYAARGLAVSVAPQEAFLLYPFLFFDDGLFSGLDLDVAFQSPDPGTARRITDAEFENSRMDRPRILSDTEKETVKNILQQRRISLPSQEQAAAILFERATDYFGKRRPLRIDGEGKVSFWIWHPDSEEGGENIVYFSKYDIETAYRYFAHKYYSQSFIIAPRASAHHEVYGLMNDISHSEYYGHRFTVYGQHEFSGIGSAALASIDNERLLQASLEKNCFYAARFAITSIQAMETREGTDFLASTNGRPRLLVQAVVAPNRKVRFAALEAIMELTGTSATQSPALEPYAGSSLVADTLVWFSQSDGESVLLSGHPQMASAVQTANLFLGLGYKTDVATTCRELFRLAAASPDVELVVVDARTPSPPVGEFVQAMRQDARTAEIPIAILSSVPNDLDPNMNIQHRRTMTEFDRRQPDAPFRTSLSLTYPLLSSEEAARWVRDDIFDKTGKELATVSPEMRLEQAKQALRWLREIKLAELSTSTKIYHFEDFDAVVLNALHSERRVSEGLQLAAVIRSAVLQSTIYEMAANAVYPMWLREQAGEAFEESIERFGILLRGAQIQRLYDRYNASELESAESQKLLGRLLDAVEARVQNRKQPR